MNDVREAMLQVYAEEFQQLKRLSGEQPEHRFSRRFQRRIRRAERLAERRVRTMRPRLRMRRAALVILLVAALMATSILAFALAFIVWRLYRGWVRILVMALAIVMAFSRLYLGAHYPTDVLAGVVVAYLGSAFVWRMGKKIGQVINLG